jgi:hypothetical protein
MTGTVAVAAGTTVVSGTVTAGDVGRTAVLIVVGSTTASSGAIGGIIAFSIYTGNTAVATSTTQYVVPAGKVLRLMYQAIALTTSAATLATGDHWMGVIVGTAAASISITSTVGIVVRQPLSLTTAYLSLMIAFQDGRDVIAGTTIGLAYTIGTSGIIRAWQLGGYLF